MRKVFRALLLLLALTPLATGCGYALAGRGNTLPATIVAIGIPAFVNESGYGGIDRTMTDAVMVEFQSKGKYRVLPQAEGADAILTGRLISVTQVPVTLTSSGVASRRAIIVTAAIEFKEVGTDRIIWANPSFQTRDEFDVAAGSATADTAALLTNDANAIERLSRAFARSVVTSIFEAF